MNIYTIIFIILILVKLTRCLIFNIHFVLYYAGCDLYTYIKDKKWLDFNYYGIDMFIGMFGHGKTLSMTHKARKLYKKHGDTIRFISNYKLVGIPYIPLVNFNQLVELGEEDTNSDTTPRYLEKDDYIPSYYYDEVGKIKKEYKVKVDTGEKDEFGDTIYTIKYKYPKYKGTVVLIDEIEDVLSHRNYATFPLQLLHTLTQQRKLKVYIMCTAQRFFMVDKLFRSITTHVIDCSKFWRMQHMRYYDAWDYEQSMNPQLVHQITHMWWFVRNKDFDCYDTTQMISKNMAEDFISNDESLVRKGLDMTVNSDAVISPSRKLKKRRKRS